MSYPKEECEITYCLYCKTDPMYVKKVCKNTDYEENAIYSNEIPLSCPFNKGKIRMRYSEKDIRTAESEPGNGTNYKAVAVRWNDSYDYNALGSIDEGWLVVNCNTTRSYLFRDKGILVDEYIQEKLGGGKGDYPYFGDLIRKLIGRE